MIKNIRSMWFSMVTREQTHTHSHRNGIISLNWNNKNGWSEIRFMAHNKTKYSMLVGSGSGHLKESKRICVTTWEARKWRKHLLDHFGNLRNVFRPKRRKEIIFDPSYRLIANKNQYSPHPSNHPPSPFRLHFDFGSPFLRIQNHCYRSMVRIDAQPNTHTHNAIMLQ